MFKETGRIVFASASYHLSVADVAPGFAVSRHMAVAPMVTYQAFMAIIFRLEVSNFDEPWAALATCLAQGVLEVILRVTAPGRDEWVKQSVRKLRCRTTAGKRRDTVLVVASTSVAPLSPQGERPDVTAKLGACSSVLLERLAEAHERRAVVSQFHTRLFVVDMWSEYAGIYIGTLVLALGQSEPLYYNFRPFRNHLELFDGGNWYRELALGSALMVVIELVTDTICILFEERRRSVRMLSVWRELPKARLLPLVAFSLMFSALAGQIRNLTGDNLQLCNHRDACFCVDNGLLPGGVREAYCLALYPNSSGRPAP